jgi:hypothetical protein
MNQLAHILITYSVLSIFIPGPQKYLLPIALFSIILDVDHIPGYARMLLMSKKERSRLKAEDYVSLFRTAIQEPIGVLAIELCFLILFLFGVESIILWMAAAAVGIHWLIDFLTVHTRPFNPVDNRIVCLFFKTKRQRIISEAGLTLLSLALFLISYF